MFKRLFGGFILLSFACSLAAQSTPAQKSARDIDPGAMAALDKMGTYLRTLKAFQVKAGTTTEDVLDNGQKIQTDGVVDLLAVKPNQLRVEVKADDKHRLFLYDGRSFTIWAALVNYYATVPAPPTIGELADKLAEKFDIE